MSEFQVGDRVMNRTEKIAARRAEKGAKWLDKHMPGWWRTIRVQALDLSSVNNCVMGQLIGTYPFEIDLCLVPLQRHPRRAMGLWEAGWNRINKVSNGFTLELPYEIPSFDELTDSWTNEIRKRRRATDEIREVQTDE